MAARLVVAILLLLQVLVAGPAAAQGGDGSVVFLRDGNVWVMPADDPAAARAVTTDGTDAPVLRGGRAGRRGHDRHGHVGRLDRATPGPRRQRAGRVHGGDRGRGARRVRPLAGRHAPRVHRVRAVRGRRAGVLLLRGRAHRRQRAGRVPAGRRQPAVLVQRPGPGVRPRRPGRAVAPGRRHDRAVVPGLPGLLLLPDGRGPRDHPRRHAADQRRRAVPRPDRLHVPHADPHPHPRRASACPAHARVRPAAAGRRHAGRGLHLVAGRDGRPVPRGRGRRPGRLDAARDLPHLGVRRRDLRRAAGQHRAGPARRRLLTGLGPGAG